MRVHRTKGRGRLLAVVAVAALLTTSCHAFFYDGAVTHQENSPHTRPWWCHSAHGDGHDHGSEHYEGVMKGMLSWDDCLEVSNQLDETLAWARQWPTRGDAEAAGFLRLVNYATGMGTHHMAPGGDFNDAFDPTRPEFLQYASNTPDAPLVGMSWYVYSDGHPPAGFAGDNDWWHVHEDLCLKGGIVIGDGLTDEECAARGGTNIDMSKYWMLHAWIVPGMQHYPDVFVNHHPCLQPGGVADFGDHCWTMATTPAGDHTEH